MIINLNINTADPLDEHERVILLALAGEISLGEATEPRERVVTDPGPAHTPSAEGLAAIERDAEARSPQGAIAEAAEEVSEAVAEAAEEKPTRTRVVNVSEASLKKYGFHQDEDGQVVCDHCDFVSETGRALHLHANTHKDEGGEPSPLTVVKDEPEAGVSAFTSTEPDKQDVEDAERAAAGDPDPEPEPVAEVPEPIEAKVVDPKELRDQVAKVATEMVAAQMQSDIRSVLDDLGVARVSMIAEEDLQTFLDAQPIADFIKAQKKKAG